MVLVSIIAPIQEAFRTKKTMGTAEDERRDFERVKGALSVHYHLLSVSDLEVSNETYDGTTEDINPRGILLHGKLPSLDLIVPLLTEKLIVDVNIDIPSLKTHANALATVKWVEKVDAETGTCSMGLHFDEISAEDRQKLFEFLVWQRKNA